MPKEIIKKYSGGSNLWNSSPVSTNLGYTAYSLPNYNNIYAMYNSTPSLMPDHALEFTDKILPTSNLVNLSAGLTLSRSSNPSMKAQGTLMAREASSDIISSGSDISSYVIPTNIKKTFSEKFQNSTFGQNFENWSSGLDTANNIITSFTGGKSEYSGDKGSLTQGLDSAYDTISDTVAAFGPWGLAASLIMKGGLALGNVVNSLGGGTNGMTTTDAILGSSFLNLTPFGLINGFGGKKADTITKDLLAFEQVGSSYGGTASAVDDALKKSGKKYGLFSSGARRDANEEIAEAKRQQRVMSEIASNATDRFNILQSMSAMNANRRAFELQGGYLQANIRVGKSGMSLDIILKAKYIIKALKGTKIDPIKYSIERFPILKNVNVVLQYDPLFKPEGFGNIEYMDATHDDLPYYIVNGAPYLKKEKGKSAIIYNDKANQEDVALDMLSHGLRELDKYWKTNIIPLLENEESFKNAIREELFWEYGISPNEWKNLSNEEKQEMAMQINKLLDEDLRFGRRRTDKEYDQTYNNILDGLIRALLVKDEYRKSRRYDYPQEFLDSLRNTNAWKKAYNYIMGINPSSMKNGGVVSTIELVNPEDDIQEFQEGGSMNYLTTIELTDPEDDIQEFQEGGSINIIPEGSLHARKHHMNIDGITKKGIPVVDNNGEQLAEIEREEIIFRLEVTKKLEELEKKFRNKDTSLKQKDEYALEAGKLLVDEILYNTQDNTNNLL